jgi:hypothetical protein
MRNNKHIKDTYELEKENYTLLIDFEYLEERETNYKGLDIIKVLYNGITDITRHYLLFIDEDELEEEIINSLDI